VLFAAWIESGSMIHLFLLPALLVLALLVAAGVESVAVWLHALGGRPAAAAGALALLVAMVVPGPWIRETAEAHPITRWRFQVEEEDASLHAGWIPNLSGFHEAERYGQIASRMIPRDALFVADWGELNVLRYLQAVEGVRRDLTLQQTTPTTLPARLAVWQRDHDLGRRPFVFTRLVPELGRIYAIDESLTVMPGRKLYVQRTPIAAALSRP
jgi:hypothetical protein